PVRGHADTVLGVIRSPQTAVHFVTVLEEMPVQETLDGVAELRGLAPAGLQLGGIMINMVRPVELADDQLAAAAAGRLDVHDLALGLKAAGIEDTAGPPGNLDPAASLPVGLTEHARESPAQGGQRELLADIGQACGELPLITGRVVLGGLCQAPGGLREQGGA